MQVRCAGDNDILDIMKLLVLPLITMLLYVSSAMSHCFPRRRSQYLALSGLLLAMAGFFLHGFLLYKWIDVPTGQNLTVLNLISLTVWLMIFVAMVVAVWRRFSVMLFFTVGLGMCSILLALLFPSQNIIDSDASPEDLFHILLSIVTAGILGIVGLNALLLAVQERLLRLRPDNRLIRQLPPLMTMERLLFQTSFVGFVLLTILFFSSVYFFHHDLSYHIILWPKTILAFSAWCIFALLLVGRFWWGLRGIKAVYVSLSGVLLLVIVYYGSKWLLLGIH